MDSETTGQGEAIPLDGTKAVSDILNLLKGNTYRNAVYLLNACISRLQEWSIVQELSE